MLLIHSCMVAVILVGYRTPFVTSGLLSPMVWFVCLRMSHCPRTLDTSGSFKEVLLIMSIFSSDACEESVFQELLKICDGLQEKLLASSEEEVELVADLVSFWHVFLWFPTHLYRFKRGRMSSVLMTPKVWKWLSLIGSHPMARMCLRLLIRRSRPHAVSIMRGLELCCVPRV